MGEGVLKRLQAYSVHLRFYFESAITYLRVLSGNIQLAKKTVSGTFEVDSNSRYEKRKRVNGIPW